jgi:hypothetical protein
MLEPPGDTLHDHAGNEASQEKVHLPFEVCLVIRFLSADCSLFVSHSIRYVQQKEKTAAMPGQLW